MTPRPLFPTRLRNIIQASVLIFLSLALSCRTPEKPADSRIILTGTLKNFSDSVTTFTCDPLKLLAATQKPVVSIHPDGTFRLVLDSEVPVRGFFSLGRVPYTYRFNITLVDGRDSSLTVESADFRMIWVWLEPGDSVNITADAENIQESLSFSGRGADNCRFVNDEENRFNDYPHKYLGNYYHITYRQPDDYKTVVNRLREEKLAYLSASHQKRALSPRLVDWYRSEYMNDAISSKISYPSGHAGFNNGREALLPPDYWSFLDSAAYPDEIGSGGIGQYYFLNGLLRRKYDLDPSISAKEPDFYGYVVSQLPPRAAWEFMAYSLARDFRKSLYERFGTECPYPDITTAVKEKYRHMEGMLEGNPAPDFTLESVSGTPVSLQDLRGRYVYIDFWATWCGPCIKEIPYLKQIEEAYRGKNITFLSISYDKAADHEKWKNYVIGNQLTGLQVIASGEMKTVYDKTFNIDLIPRFILLDPEGKIVSGNAPRPSSPKLKELFDKLL